MEKHGGFVRNSSQTALFPRTTALRRRKVKNVWNIPLIPLEKLRKYTKLHKTDNIFSTFILRFRGRHSLCFVL